MASSTNIALFLSGRFHYGAQLLQGIYRFATPDRGWNLLHFDRPADVAQLPPSSPIAGVIAHITDTADAEALQRLGAPIINTSARLPELPIYRVGIDDQEVGRMAVQYLYRKGIRHLSFYGPPEFGFTRMRYTGFVQEAARLGCSCHPWLGQEEQGRSWRRPQSVAALQRQLARLPKPLGVLADTGKVSSTMLPACRQHGLLVPRDVAILGVGFSPSLCEAASPTLSSITVPGEQVGYSAARLLADLIAGRAVPASPFLCPPTGIVERESTDALAIEDEYVAAAVRFIGANVQHTITVEHLLAAVPLSRRALERRFRAALGHAPQDEIHRARIEQAKQLLAETDLSMAHIAHACGFRNNVHLSRLFHHLTGQPPRVYRKRFRPW